MSTFDRGDRVSIQRIRHQAVRDLRPEAIQMVLRELGPDGGDYVVIRATPDRAEAIERNLVSQLLPMGAHVAGPPVSPLDRYPSGTTHDPVTGKPFTTPDRPWCTCGCKSMDGFLHASDCPARRAVA